MKKIVLALLVGFCGFAQDYPRDAVELVVGKELGIQKKEIELQKYDFRDFYKSPDFNNIKSKSYRKSIKLSYSDIIDEKFILLEANQYEHYGKKKFVFKLSNKKYGILYYDYDPNFNLSWIFYIEGGITYPEGYWCKDIEKKDDKFTNEVRFNSPSSEHVSFIKDKGIIYIYLTSHGKTLNVNQKGIIILLKDGSKITNETANIDVKPDGDGWYTYTSMFALSTEDISKISNSYITDYRLFVYDFALDNGTLFSEYLKCLSKM